MSFNVSLLTTFFLLVKSMSRSILQQEIIGHMVCSLVSFGTIKLTIMGCGASKKLCCSKQGTIFDDKLIYEMDTL